MSVKGLMIIGGLVLLVASMLEATRFPGISVSVFAFAGGALFGKGYGIWEQRQKPSKPKINQTKEG